MYHNTMGLGCVYNISVDYLSDIRPLLFSVRVSSRSSTSPTETKSRVRVE